MSPRVAEGIWIQEPAATPPTSLVDAFSVARIYPGIPAADCVVLVRSPPYVNPLISAARENSSRRCRGWLTSRLLRTRRRIWRRLRLPFTYALVLASASCAETLRFANILIAMRDVADQSNICDPPHILSDRVAFRPIRSF